MGNPGSLTAETASAAAAKSHGSPSRQLLKHALDFEQFAHEAMTKMRGSLSFTDPETARANAQALSSVSRSWSEAMEWVRIRRKEPMPGSRRPVPDVAKPVKKKLRCKPPE